jgi:surface antigen
MKFTLLALALGASFVVVLLGSQSAHAVTQPEEKPSEKQETIVVVKAGDTLSAIAETYGITYVELFNANESIANPDQIDIGDEVRIPQKEETLPDRFSNYQSSVTASPLVYQSTAITTPRSVGPTPASSSYYVGNGMWCTDYVHSRRPDIPIYGNAGYNWISAAQAEGRATGTIPQAGAIAVMSGHVAYVESVNGDGSYVVSEMGWDYKAGNYNIRTVRPGAFGGFIY